MSDRPRKGSYAFWSYDSYPYMIGAKINKTRLRQYRKPGESKYEAMCEGFSGYWFPAKVVLPPALGAQVENKLSWLKAQKREAIDRVTDEFDRTLIAVLEDNGRSTALVDKIIPDHAKTEVEAN